MALLARGLELSEVVLASACRVLDAGNRQTPKQAPEATIIRADAITDRVKRSAPRLVGEVAVGNERSRHPDEIRIARRNDCVRVTRIRDPATYQDRDR